MGQENHQTEIIHVIEKSHHGSRHSHSDRLDFTGSRTSAIRAHGSVVWHLSVHGLCVTQRYPVHRTTRLLAHGLSLVPSKITTHGECLLGPFHLFTLVQLICLIVLCVVNLSPSNPVKIMFPIFIAFLVPVRALLGRFIDNDHLAYLDADEEPDDEGFHWV